MAKTIDTPEGPIDFPDNMTDDQIIGVLRQHFGAPKEPELTGTEKAVGTLRNVAQGATLGFGDELERLAAGAGGAVAGAVSGENPLRVAQETYQEYGPQMQQERARYQRQSPGLTFAGELLGGLAMPGSTKLFEYVKNAPTAVKGIGRSTLASALLGGGYGAGSAEDSDRTKSALAGAAGGALLGGGLAAGGRALAPSVTTAGKKISDFMNNQSVVGANPATRKLAERLMQSGVNPADLPAMIEKAGGGATIADVAGPQTRSLARALVTMPGESRGIAEQAFNERRGKMGERLLESARTNLGDVSGDVYKTQDELIKQRAQQAAPLYEQAMQQSVAPETMAAINSDPYLQGVFKSVQADTLQGLGGQQPNSLMVLDAVKKQLDDQIGAAVRSGEKNRARLLMEKRDMVVGAADQGAPMYREARAAWEAPSRAMDTMQMGRDFMKGDPEVLARNVAVMAPEDLQFFRQGAMRELQNMVESGTGGLVNLRKRLETPKARQQLAQIFPDQQSFDAFMGTIEAEGLKHGAAEEILRGSQTAQTMAEQLSLGSDKQAALASLLQGRPREAVGQLVGGKVRELTSGMMTMSEQNRNALGRMLFSTDPAEQKAAIDALNIRVQNTNELNDLINTARESWLALSPVATGQISGGITLDKK